MVTTLHADLSPCSAKQIIPATVGLDRTKRYPQQAGKSAIPQPIFFKLNNYFPILVCHGNRSSISAKNVFLPICYYFSNSEPTSKVAHPANTNLLFAPPSEPQHHKSLPIYFPPSAYATSPQCKNTSKPLIA